MRGRIFIGLTLLGAACSLGVGEDLADGKDDVDAGDASVADSAIAPAPDSGTPATADASDSAVDAGGSDAQPTSVLLNGDFEQGCGGWQAYAGTSSIVETTDAHTGTNACIACRMSGNDGDVGFVQYVTTTMAPSQSLHGEVWLHEVADGGTPSVKVVIKARTAVNSDNGAAITTSAPVVPGPAWQHVTAIVPAPQGAVVEVGITVSAGAPAGTRCFILDDARLYAE